MNSKIDYLRKNSKRAEVSIDDYIGLISDEQNFESDYIKEERKITVHRAIGKLKIEYRQILWLI